MVSKKKKPFAKVKFDEIVENELKSLSDSDIELQHEQMKRVREKVKAAPMKPLPSVRITRIPTGIPGFDELIEGGLEKNSTVLIIGGAGTGKTTFILQYLYNGAVRYKQPGVFLSFEEPKEKLYKHMLLFGWDFAELEKKKMFTYLQYAPHQVEKIMEEGGGTIRDAIDDIGTSGSYETVRFGMDSLTSFITMFKDEYEARENVVKFFENLAEWNCTSLVTIEPHHVSPETPSTEIGVEFMADGVVALYMIKIGDRRETALEILKMKATNHARKICPYKFDRNGIIVYPKEVLFGTRII